MNLYEDLAERLKTGIRQGIYPPGQRAPSVRRYATLQRVSPASVVAAYRLLESQGWLEARPQSGHYVSLPLQTPPRVRAAAVEAAPCQVNVAGLVARLFAATRREDLISFGAAVPSPALLPLRELREAANRALRRSPNAASHYSFPPGEEALRVQVARRGLEAGCALDPDEIEITSGCQEALLLALRAVTRAGDIVAIESPAYFGALQTIESLGLQALEIPCDDDGISLEALALALERWPVKAALVVSNFSNPTGSCLPDERKRQLVKLLKERAIPLIEDDVYGDLAYARDRPRAAKAYDADGGVLYCGSYSKTIAPGYRVGWLVPGRWRQEVEHLKRVSTMATATLPQLAVAEYLASGRYERHLARLRRTVETNLRRAQDVVARHFPPGTRVSQPQGGYLFWVQLPEGSDAMALYQTALTEGISLTPGPLFSPRGKYANCLRLCVGMAWEKRVEEALVRVGRMADRTSG